MGVDQKVKFIFRIHLTEMADPLQRVLRPCLQIRPSALIVEISLYNPGKLQIILAALFIPADIFLDHHLIAERLIRRLQDHLAKIASRVKILHCDKIFQTVGISYKFLRRNVGVLHIEKISDCAHIDLQVSPRILLDRESLLARFRQGHKCPALLLQGEEDLLLLLASYEELLKGMLVKLPLAHVVIQSLYPHVLVF